MGDGDHEGCSYPAGAVHTVGRRVTNSRRSGKAAFCLQVATSEQAGLGGLSPSPPGPAFATAPHLLPDVFHLLFQKLVPLR